MTHPVSPPCVIAATDLTARSAHAAGRAARLAATLGARLILAHVEAGDGKADARPKPPSAAEALADEARHVGAEPRLLRGDPVESLAGLAEREGAELIVLGLHRERRVLDLLRLTTMERIVLRAPCPVLIAQWPPEHDYTTVLAPTAFSPASAAALRMAVRIAPGAAFHAVHALQLPLGGIFRRGNRESEAALERAEARRAAFLAQPGLPAWLEPPLIVPGGVHQVLSMRREELHPDLVVIGAQSGRDPNSLGNYARDLMRAPPTDLLVARPG